MAHISSCPSLAYIYLYQSTHYIIYNFYPSFRCTLCLLKYSLLRSAAWHQLTTPAGPSLYISYYFTPTTCRRAFVRGLIAGGHLYTPYHGHWSAGNCTQRLRTGTSPTCPTYSAGGTVRTSVRMSNNLPF